MSGQSPNFSDEEVELLREAARELRAKNKWSQADLGLAMGISQQNAGRFVAAGSTTGIGRTAANNLARRSGFRGAEHLLLERGVLAEMEAPTVGPWADRDVAVRIAKKMGYADEVVDLVVKRYAEASYTAKPMRWWVEKIVLEAVALREEPAPERTAAPLHSDIVPKKRTRTAKAAKAKP